MRKKKSSRMSSPLQTKLSNGLKVIYLFTKNDPISACHLFIPGGVNQEPKDKEGITTLLWSLLLKGTRQRSAKELAEEIEGIGASIGAGATHDYSEISCHSISDYFFKAIQIMGDVLFQPAFLASEVEKEKTALIASIQAKKENIFTVAYEEFNRQIYGDHVYGRPTSGYEKTVAGLTSADLLGWHKKIVLPNQAILVMASNIPFEIMLKDITRIFGPLSWKRGKIAGPKNSKTPKKSKGPVVTRRYEVFEQAYLTIGVPAPATNSKDYIPLKIINGCLGGGMSARLFQELREKRGLAYDIGSFYPSKKFGSSFVVHMGLQPTKIKEAEEGIKEELKKIQQKKISSTELTQIKNYLKGTYILDHQTNSQRAHYLGWWQIVGMKPSYDFEYIKQMDRITPDQVQHLARRIFGQKFVTVEIHPQEPREVSIK